MTLKTDGSIAFWMLFVVTLVGTFLILSLDSEGAFTANTYNTTATASANYGVDPMVHSKDDQYVVAYCANSELWVAHKPTTGGSWGYGLVDNAYAVNRVVGILCSSNNTLIIYAHRLEGGTYKAYIWIKWPGSDWDDWTGYYISGGSTFSAMDFAINNTDDICFCYRTTTPVYFGIFNLTTLTVTSSSQFTSGTNSYGRVKANQSGDFWCLYSTNGLNAYFIDYNKTVGATTISTGYPTSMDLACLPNDRFVASAYYSYGVTKKIQFMYQNSHNGAWTKISYVDTQANHNWAYPKLMTSQGSTTVWIIATDSTDTKVYTWNAAYNAVSATWQASETEVSSGTFLYGLGGSLSVWPKTAGISWCIPESGQAMHIFKEDGTPDIHQIWTQSISWTPDLTTAWPEITTAALDSGTYNVPYSFTMSSSGGTAPLEWTIVSGPVWLSIGLATGELTGTPPGIGTFVVEIQLADVIPRTDTETFNLVINSAVTGGGDADDGLLGTWGISSALMGDLWVLFVVTAMSVGVFTAYRKYTDRVAGWQYAQRRYSQYRRPIYGGYRRWKKPPPRPKYRYRY